MDPGTEASMATPPSKCRPRLVVPLVLAAAMAIAPATRPVSAQSRTGAACMSVTVTVVRGCLVDTSAGGGVGVTCSQTTAPDRLQSLTGAAAPLPGGIPTSTYTVTRTADGRVVIQF
jgi:hypothetical protein